MALALNSAGETPNAWISRYKPLVYAPFPLLAAGALFYLFLVFNPTASTYHAMRRASAELPDQRKQQGTTGPKITYMSPGRIVEPLEQTRKEDGRDNAQFHLYLAGVYRDIWLINRGLRIRGKTAVLDDQAKKALLFTQIAQTLDPEGKEGYYAEYNLRRTFAEDRDMMARQELPRALPAALGPLGRQVQILLGETDEVYQAYRKEEREQYQLAADALLLLEPKDPTNCRLQFQLAEALFRADKPEEAREHALKARNLHQQTNWATRKLSKEQSAQVARWLNEPEDN
jgi:hypothetical protein